MEIPYIVTPRKDTGLCNSKIAIWLFLASEVMLFGGFFSAYVFLRLGADYPWPERTLPVLPGLINTFVLIGSSVTVVFAWAALKMREWRKFQIYMGITVFCAAIFMVLKGVEYNVKLNHQGVRLKDYTVMEGHLAYEKDQNGYVLDHNGKKSEGNLIFVEAAKLTFTTVRYHGAWVDDLLAKTEHKNAKILLSADVAVVREEGEPAEVIAKAGEALSRDLLKRIRDSHLAARSHNGALRTASLREEWKTALAENPDKKGWELTSNVNIDIEGITPKLLTETPNVVFNVVPPVSLSFKPRDIKEADGQSRLRDDTVVDGKLLPSPMVFHNVDAIDFQHLAMKAVKRGVDPIVAIENSWLLQNSPFAKEAWDWHQGEVAKQEAQLIRDYGMDAEGKPKREPTLKERYRIGWKELAEKAEHDGRAKLSTSVVLTEEFMGPNYKARGVETFPEFSLPREQVGFAAKFTPAWNTYYALYFVITGLHGLHVIGGALVLGYYMFFGRKMYLANPEWLANRVEVGGLFWHFVDLVWIFVFPVLYLM